MNCNQENFEENLKRIENEFQKSKLIILPSSFLQDDELSDEDLKYLKEKTENYDSPPGLLEPLLHLFNDVLKSPIQLLENQRQKTRQIALEILSKGNFLISSKYSKILDEMTEM